MSGFKVDFVACDPWRVVLVEEGPWDDVVTQLSRLQERLYQCVDAVIDGQLVAQFPDSHGCVVTICLDGYDLPQPHTREFFERFSSSVLQLPDYAAALADAPHVSAIEFSATFY